MTEETKGAGNSVTAWLGRQSPRKRARRAKRTGFPLARNERSVWSCADRIDGLFAAQHAGDIGGAFALQFLQRLDRIECCVRRDDHIVAAEQGRILGE